MGFAKSQTEAYYLLSEKTMELDSPPELLALCGARESRAALAPLAPVWEGAGVQQQQELPQPCSPA